MVPEPGTYVKPLHYDHLKGKRRRRCPLPALPDSRRTRIFPLNLWRSGCDASHLTRQLFGGDTCTLTLTIPFPVDTIITISAVSAPRCRVSNIDDSTPQAIGDISLTGLVGWHRGNLHYSTGMTVYAPTGEYETASINVQ